MKTYYFLLVLLLSSCTSYKATKIKEYDYSDIETMIQWNEIFIQNEESYSVFFYSQTCGHCKELKQDILSYYFGNYERLYFVETDDNTVFGPQNDLVGVDSIEEFYIFGTPFLINVDNWKVSNYYAGNAKIRDYIASKTSL